MNRLNLFKKDREGKKWRPTKEVRIPEQKIHAHSIKGGKSDVKGARAKTHGTAGKTQAIDAKKKHSYVQALHQSAVSLKDRVDKAEDVVGPAVDYDAVKRRRGLKYIQAIANMIPKMKYPPPVSPHDKHYAQALHESAVQPADRHYARVGSFAIDDFGTSPYIQDVLKRVRLDQVHDHTDYEIFTFTQAFAPDVFDPKLGPITLAGYKGYNPRTLRQVFHDSTWMLQTRTLPEFQSGIKYRRFSKPGTVRNPFDYDGIIDENPPPPIPPQYLAEYIVKPRVFFFSKPGTIRNPYDFDFGDELKDVRSRMKEEKRKSSVRPETDNPDDYGVNLRSKYSKTSKKDGQKVTVEMEEKFSELHHNPSLKASGA